MKNLNMALAALFMSLLASPLAAAEESQAKSWNLSGETKQRFEAKVVDILCELAGDCVDNCGGGDRHLGLLKSDGTLVLANKNNQPIFSGAAVDLAPYCGIEVEVDGLMVGEEGGPRLYQIQMIRKSGTDTFTKADLWSKKWNEANPDLAKIKGPWFRKDKRILKRIKKDGYLGLGLDVDKKYIAEEQ